MRIGGLSVGRLLPVVKKGVSMPHHSHVCPWWIGYFLASPLRRRIHNPDRILAPYVRSGMRILEIGPGMGFFTIPMAGMVGAEGRIIFVKGN